MTPLTPTEIQQAIELRGLPELMQITFDICWESDYCFTTTELDYYIPDDFGIQLLANHIEAELAKKDYLYQFSGCPLVGSLRFFSVEFGMTEWHHCQPTNPLSRAAAIIRASLEVKP